MKKYLIHLLFLGFIFNTNAQWTKINPGVNVNSELYSVSFIDDLNGYAVGLGGVIKTTNGGNTWQKISYGSMAAYYNGTIIYSIKAIDINHIVLMGYSFSDNAEIVVSTDDGGVTWNTRHLGAFNSSLNDGYFPTNNIGYVVGDGGRILKSTNGGINWTTLTSGVTNDLNGVHFINPLEGFVVGDNIILKTTNGGSTWITTNVSYYLNAVFMTSTSEVIAVGNGGAVLNTLDGMTWIKKNNSFITNFNSICFYNNNYYIASDDGILKSKDGSYWVTQTSTANSELNYITYSSSGYGYAVGTEIPSTNKVELIYKTTNEGEPLPQNDASVSAIENSGNLCPGTIPINIKIKNFGISPLNSATLHWSINGVEQPVYNWTGSLLSDSTSAYLTIGMYNFPGGTTSIESWTSNPNGLSDDNTLNDRKQTIFTQNKMAGIYTIGGATPSFPTFTSAVNALTSRGLCGPVKFKIRNGNYNENIGFSYIPGASLVNTITFESESGINTDVVLYSTNANYIVNLSDADYITFNKITIGSSNSFGRPILLNGQAEYNRITNNILEVKTTGISCPSDFFAIKFSTGKESNNIISNNIIKNGCYGVYLTGTTTFKGKNNVITGNTFVGGQENSIYASYQKNILIDENIISSTSTSGNYNGIYITSCDSSLTIRNNKLTINVGKGISIENSNPGIFKGLIYNNYVQGNATGISIYNSSAYQVYHNTVQIIGNGGGVAFVTNQNTNLTVKNNIFSNKGGGVAISYTKNNDSQSLTNCDYNNLYSSGSLIGNGDIVSFNDWQNTYNIDLHSISVDPQLKANDPHIYLATSNYALSNAGTSLPDVTQDYDKELRDVTNPDIGADEFTTPNLDAALINIVQDSNVCVGSNNIQIKIKNFGQSTLSTLKVGWSVNGVSQAPYNWIGAIAVRGTSNFIDIGNFNFTSGSSQVLKVWIYQPNGTTDLNTLNDTISKIVNAKGLSGIYTVGGTAPNFPTFTAALNALKSGGVCGTVTFKIRPGIYNESLTIPQINGTNEYNTITFQSEALDTSSVRLISSNTPITLDGADHIVFKYLTIQVSSGGNCIEIKNNSNYNIFSNNYFKISQYYIGINSTSGTDEFNIIEFNKFEGGSTGIQFKGGGASNLEKGNIIRNNIFSNQSNYGAQFNSQYRITITDNYLNTTAINNYTGFYLWICNNGFRIERNQFYVPLGIRFDDCISQDNNRGLIANNIISSNSGTGIYFYNTQNINVFYNTIKINGGPGSAPLGGSPTKITIYNNILFNEGTGYAMNFPTIDNSLMSDYNLLYTNGSYFSPCITGCPNSNYYPTNLAEYITKFNRDQHSVSNKPFFISSNDLHMMNDTKSDGAGLPLTEITTDIDGQGRDNTNPDIGADEFNAIGKDAGVISFNSTPCDLNGNIFVGFKNYGFEILKSAIINWSVNGIVQPAYLWSGSLITGDTITNLKIGNFAFTYGTPYNIKVWSSNPNSGTDANILNDAFTYYTEARALHGSYTIGGMSPNYATINDAVNDLKNYGICSAVIFKIRPGIYTEQLTIPNIKGISIQNTITFQSETLDRNDVTIQYSSGSNNNFVFNLTNASNFIFNELFIRALNVNNSVVIRIDKESENIKIQHCKLQSLGSAYYYNTSSIYVLDSKNIYIYDNTIENGLYTIAMVNGSNLQIENNSLLTGIYLTNISDLLIHNNYINSYSGIQIQSCLQFEITNNKIFTSTGGLTISNSAGTSNLPALVSNNFIKASSFTTCSFDGSSYINLYSNTIYQTGNDYTYRAFKLSSGSNNKIKNNILANFGIGFVVETTTNIESNYNNFYAAPSGYIGRIAGRDCYNLDSWQIWSQQDANSVSANPLFVSLEDPHIISNPALEGKGTNIPEIKNDIDGQRRKTNPDIGADEFNPAKNNIDAGILNINNFAAVCSGNQPISLKVKNFGTYTLTSLNVYVVINKDTLSNVWTGNLVSQDTLESVLIGNYNFIKDTIYTIKTWTAKPNGLTDEQFVNDTIFYLFKGIAIGGTYTIGGTSPDFITISKAIQSIQDKGICSAVIFNIRTGIYNEKLAVSNVPGSSTANTITFQAESGNRSDVTIVYTERPLELNNASYTIFKNLTLRSTNPDFSNILHIRNNSHHNYFNNILFNAAELTNVVNTDQQSLILFDQAIVSSYNTFENNSFLNGYFGITCTGNPTDKIPVKGTIIRNNIFTNLSSGLMLESSDSTTIEGNTMSQFKILPGKFQLGINILGSKNFNVSRNKILDVTDGIFVTNCNLPNSQSFISNNFISQNLGYIVGTGIDISNGGNLNIYHNNVLTLTLSGSDGWSSSLYVRGEGDYKILNNIFENRSQNGYTIAFGTPTSVSKCDYNCYYGNPNYFGSWDYANQKLFTNLNDWKDYSKTDSHSVFINPQFISDRDLHIKNANLKGKGTPIANIVNDIDNEPRNPLHPYIGADEYPAFDNDAGLLILPIIQFNPTEEELKVRVINWGSNLLTSFDISWQINGIQEPLYSWTGTLSEGDTTEFISLGSYKFSPNQNYSVEIICQNPNGVEDPSPINNSFLANFITEKVANLGSDIGVCEGTPVVLNPGSGFVSYLWNDGQSSISSTISISGTYNITVTDKNGFISKDTIEVNFYDLPAKPIITENGNLLSTSTAFSYQWYKDGVAIPGAISQNFTVTESGNYSVIITNPEGCEATSDFIPFITNGIISGINEEISFYPNPVQYTLTILVPDSEKEYQISIRDLQGSMCIENLKHSSLIDLSNYPAGPYFIEIRTGETFMVKMILKQ